MVRFLTLITALSLSACSQTLPPDLSKLSVKEVELVSVEYVPIQFIKIEFYDKSRNMVFKEGISCYGDNKYQNIANNIGKTYKVYDLSDTILPEWYELDKRFC